MSEETRKPDALLAPASWKNKGADAMARGQRFVMDCERILGTDYDGGQRAHVRLAEGTHHFVTHDPHDTLYFPAWHARSGQSRYRWAQQDDGSVHGFYVDDEARETADESRRRSGDPAPRRS